MSLTDLELEEKAPVRGLLSNIYWELHYKAFENSLISYSYSWIVFSLSIPVALISICSDCKNENMTSLKKLVLNTVEFV